MRTFALRLADAAHALCKRDVLRMFSRTLYLFNKSSDSKLDVVELALMFSPIPTETPAFLIEFFHAVRKQLEGQGRSKEEALQTAIEALSEYAATALCLHMCRQKDIGSLPPNKSALLDNIKPTIQAVETEILKWVPCTSTKDFDGKNVKCNNLKQGHTEHRSSETYTVKVPSDKFFGLFRSNKDVQQACVWEGSFDPTPPGNFLKRVADSIPKEYHPKVKDVMQARQDWHKKYSWITNEIETRVCLGCLMCLPTSRLGCNHVLCHSCISEFSTDKKVICPLCYKPSEHESGTVPQYAGYRVLSMDGGGVRGVATLVILERIQKTLSAHLNMDLLDAFDYVIGTSAGGINALGLVAKRISIDGCKKLGETIGTKAFKKKHIIRGLLRGAFYDRKHLHEALYSVLGNTKLFGCTPRHKIATVACTFDDGSTKAALFTSYYRNVHPDEEHVLQVGASLTEAAEATSAANTYFTVK